MRSSDNISKKKKTLLEFKEVMMKVKHALVTIVAICVLFSIFSNAQAYEETNNVAGKSSFSRLFAYPTGRMIPSGVLNLSFGGSFATQGGQEFLGLGAVGLGDIAEFEFSTAHVISNIFDFSDHIGTTALKFRVHEGEPETMNPTVVVALRSNTWAAVGSSERDELTGPATGDAQNSLRGVEFETHLTTLYIASTLDVHPEWSTHLSVAWDEIRIRDIRYNYDRGGQFPTSAPDDITEGILSLSVGLEHAVNARTHSIFELGSLPEIKFDESMAKLNIEPLWQGMVGVRFYVRTLTTIDAGIRYRSDYSGLSDVEIRAGLNLGIDIQKQIRRKMRK